MLLGLGEDAHIASIFPGSPLLGSDRRSSGSDPKVAAVWAAHLNAWRITLTPPALVDARQIVMLVSGTGKPTRSAPRSRRRTTSHAALRTCCAAPMTGSNGIWIERRRGTCLTPGRAEASTPGAHGHGSRDRAFRGG